MAQTGLWEASTFKGLSAVLENPKVAVAKACQAVEDCIAANRDNLRGFFEQCFPALVARIFGYSGASWLGQVARSNKEVDAKALLRLLSPTGPLFIAMYSADADGSIRFQFPRERLPTHTQMMLATPAGRQVLQVWPQYSRTLVSDPRGVASIQVGVFQYFCYWFAFYAIKGGDGGDDGRLGVSSSTAGFGVSVRRAADALHLTRGRDTDPASRHPYLALLRQLLLEMLPRPITPATAAGGPATAASPPRASALYARTPSSKRSSDATTRGFLFYSVLFEFWLTDADQPVPVPSTAAAADRDRVPAAAAPFAPSWASTYEPPSEDLLEALGEVVRYCTAADGTSALQPAQAGPPWLPPAPMLTMAPAAAANRGTVAPLAGPPLLGSAAQPGSQALARQLYRFFYRAFSMWPDQRSIKPLLRPLMAYLAPWQAAAAAPAAALGASATAPGSSALTSHLTARASELVHRVHWLDNPARGGTSGQYGPEWEAHVLSNVPFYLGLLPLFLELSLSRVSLRGETSVADVVTVLGVLEAAPALMDLLRRVEQDFNRCAGSQPRRAEGPYAELLPWLVEQAHDWQVAATANCVGDTASVRAVPSFSLFSTADGSAAYAARDLLELSSSVVKPEAHSRLKRCLEAVMPVQDLPAHPAAAAAAAARAEAAAYDEEVPRLPRSTWRDVQYKGDPLHRPVASYEVGVLVPVLVAMSAAANRWLALDQTLAGEEPPEDRMQQVLGWVRRRRWRVNLRPLGDARTLVWLPVVWVALRTALRALGFLWWAFMVMPGQQIAAGEGVAVPADDWNDFSGDSPWPPGHN